MFRNPTTDLIVVLVIVLLIFGPKRLPGLGRSLGGGLREFKDSITGDSDSEDGHEPSALPRGDAAPASGAGSSPSDQSSSPPASPTMPAAGTPEGASERRS
jgi:sec-independent protein translocase protein TatA